MHRKTFKKKKIAIVTGSSKGIGESIQKTLESNGVKVIGLSRSLKNEKENFSCDIRNESQVKDMIKKIYSIYGSIDILVNNAGVVTTNKFSKSTYENWRNVISTNLTGPYLMCKHILPKMKKNRYGKIVNVSSVAARSFSKTASVEYTTSKYALIGLTKQLAYEYARFNININCICPSQTETEMLIKNTSKNQLKEISKSIPVKKLAQPQQIANVVNFLCSDDSDYMHGSIVDVNGGQI